MPSQQQQSGVAILGGGPITRAAAHAAASTSAPAAGDSTGYGGGKRRSGSGGGGEVSFWRRELKKNAKAQTREISNAKRASERESKFARLRFTAGAALGTLPDLDLGNKLGLWLLLAQRGRGGEVFF